MLCVCSPAMLQCLPNLMRKELFVNQSQPCTLYTMNLYNGSDPVQVKRTLFRKVQQGKILRIECAVQTPLNVPRRTIVQVQNAHA